MSSVIIIHKKVKHSPLCSFRTIDSYNVSKMQESDLQQKDKCSLARWLIKIVIIKCRPISYNEQNIKKNRKLHASVYPESENRCAPNRLSASEVSKYSTHALRNAQTRTLNDRMLSSCKEEI